ncbi:helix-turn-helix domain-containing protein [Methylomonas sp. LW13]|uniref:helix-turn-helix domain-containing protein n=1 Tax=unclassified Methylomonas TaxID=2608980 RepID=UPI00068B2BD3|nr:helix-turn-helix domain-containing protein [Methylomonas sp. LW13]QBC28837.1 helix-turn-helix domain-containing protein [Methylomonas sp. LW13]
MSFDATKWAWAQIRAGSLPFRARLVLLTLTDRYNDDYKRCNPGIACLSNDTGMHRETVMEAIKQLEASNIISVTRKCGAGSSYKFIGFNYKNQSDNADQSIDTDRKQSADADHLSPENQSTNIDQSVNADPNQSTITDPNQSVNTDTNQEIEPVNKTIKRKDKKSSSAPNAFSEFYSAYPRKKSRQKAESAWKKINPDEMLLAEIMSGLDLAKKSRDWLKDDGQYIPYPATWLNGRCWEDEINSSPSATDASGPTTNCFLGIAGMI